MRRKQFLAILLTLCMLFSMAPMTVFANETVLPAEEPVLSQGEPELVGDPAPVGDPEPLGDPAPTEEPEPLGDPAPAEETAPVFTALEFLTTAVEWVKGETYAPETTEYDLPIKKYSTSTIALQNTTLYDTEKYEAFAEYTDINGQSQKIDIGSGKSTQLTNQPFDESVLTITIRDKENTENKTVYTFNVTRPRDTTKTIKAKGIVLTPNGRNLSASTYTGYLAIESSLTEGTMLKVDEEKNPTYNASSKLQTGVSTSHYEYRTFLYDDAQSFALQLTPSTEYEHIRYSVDSGLTWSDTFNGTVNTTQISFGEASQKEVLIEILDDAAFFANTKAGKEGFFEAEPSRYTLLVDKITLNAPKILTAEASSGDWYPAFDPDTFTNKIMIENAESAPTLTFTVPEGSIVTLGSTPQEPNEEGAYEVTLTSSSKINVTSQDGSFTNTYAISFGKKSAFDVPDRVVDFLCMGSQYTNVATGLAPETTLSGSLKSLGNFGGYITYYYEDGIVDDPNNAYGMDFYVIGNAFAEGGSAAENGQMYVSEDGETWYALAGSEHYETKAHWDYEITYTKDRDGKAIWTDNKGNTGANATLWPDPEMYYMNDVGKKDTYKFRGIVFDSQMGTIMGDSSTGEKSFTAAAKFGYTDYYKTNISGSVLKDVNPYVETPTMANGLDLAWAVDEKGMPIDVAGKEFHYIKVATASNIWAGGFKEKSTEVAYVIRTVPQESAVGKTALPSSITITEGAEKKVVNLVEGQKVYSVNLDKMKYVSIGVNGAAAEDNIYINNQRIASEALAEGFKVTKENGETLVRVIVQNGEKEPVIALLKLTSNAKESDKILEGIKIDASGNVREATTKNGTEYIATVGHKISSVSINPVISKGVTFTINGEEAKASYDLAYGENTFEIEGTISEKTETVSLIVTREEAPAISGEQISVSFALYGDEKHGDSEIHTYKDNKSEMLVWIAQKTYKVDASATVLDVFEMALEEANISWKNEGGNYISKINGLSEFDNGELSGWMYLINGKYPDLGLAEQSLKNGDKIIFHYTDDYTNETGTEKWKKPASETTQIPEEQTTTAEEKQAEVKTEVEIKGTIANMKADEKSVSNAIEEAKKNDATELVFSTGETKDLEKVNMELPSNAIKDIAENKDLSIKIETNVGSVNISNEMLNSILDQSEANQDLNIAISTNTAEDVTEASEKIKTIISDSELKNAIIVEVKISAGDKNIHTFGGNELVIDIPLDNQKHQKHQKGKTYDVHIVSSNGDIETVAADCIEKIGKKYISIRTKHLSSFIITDKESIVFEDIEGHWAYDAIKYATSRQIMQGTSKNTFAPNTEMTRAMLVTVLYRLENNANTQDTKKNAFADVKSGDWYAESVDWAAANGIVSGIGQNSFAPNMQITREQLATILYRYVQYKKQDVSAGANTNILSYSDANQISEYAISAIQWMVGENLIKGETDSTINPKNNCTRAQVATILMRYLDV